MTRFEKTAILTMLRDLRKEITRVGGQLTQSSLIVTMNSLLLTEGGETHWKYGTPTMFSVCDWLASTITHSRPADEFSVSRMPILAESLDTFARANIGNVRVMIDLVDEAVDTVSMEEPT